MNPTTYVINSCDKLIDDKNNVVGVHLIITLSRVIPNQVDDYHWKYETVLDPKAVNDIKTGIEDYLKGGIIQNFDKEADALETKALEVKPTKQSIDTSAVVLDLAALKAASADGIISDSQVDPIS